MAASETKTAKGGPEIGEILSNAFRGSKPRRSKQKPHFLSSTDLQQLLDAEERLPASQNDRFTAQLPALHAHRLTLQSSTAAATVCDVCWKQSAHLLPRPDLALPALHCTTCNSFVLCLECL